MYLHNDGPALKAKLERHSQNERRGDDGLERAEALAELRRAVDMSKAIKTCAGFVTRVLLVVPHERGSGDSMMLAAFTEANVPTMWERVKRVRAQLPLPSMRTNGHVEDTASTLGTTFGWSAIVTRIVEAVSAKLSSPHACVDKPQASELAADVLQAYGRGPMRVHTCVGAAVGLAWRASAPDAHEEAGVSFDYVATRDEEYQAQAVWILQYLCDLASQPRERLAATVCPT